MSSSVEITFGRMRKPIPLFMFQVLQPFTHDEFSLLIVSVVMFAANSYNRSALYNISTDKRMFMSATKHPIH